MTDEDTKCKERISVLEESVVFVVCCGLRDRKDMKRMKRG